MRQLLTRNISDSVCTSRGRSACLHAACMLLAYCTRVTACVSRHTTGVRFFFTPRSLLPMSRRATLCVCVAFCVCVCGFCATLVSRDGEKKKMKRTSSSSSSF